MKKLVLVLAMAVLVLCSGGGGLFAQNFKWETYDDKVNKGTSQITLTPADETIKGLGTVKTYSVKGSVTTAYLYGYVGLQIIPDDDATQALLQKAKTVSFKIIGDGNTYRFKLATPSVIKDGNAYGKDIVTTKDKEVAVTVDISKLTAESWSHPKAFQQDKVESIQLQTIGQNPKQVGNFAFKVYDFQVK
jgi:hypothetical protein